MKLFIDTETTGLADFYRPASAPHQPRIVQLAALLTDEEGDDVDSFSVIIKPDGFTIPTEAAAIHGITTETAIANGIPTTKAMDMLRGLAEKSDRYIAHNCSFDSLMVTIEAVRQGWDLKHPLLDKAKWFCTMKATTPICQLPGLYGDYKWPKLQEAFQFAFGQPFVGAHDALADVRACKRIYFWLQERNKPKARDFGELPA